jgi:hypothetical protein
MADTFKCDNCGREFPVEQMKEVFKGDGDDQKKYRLDPECLDEWMNKGDEVVGVPGEEKRRAAFISEGGEQPPTDETYGKRE